MTSIHNHSALLLVVIGACAASTGAPEPTASESSQAKASASALSGNYTVQAGVDCGGTFNVNDPSTIDATASTLSISQDIDTPPGEQVFFEAPLGDHIARPTQFDIDHGYTQVDRTIASYGDNGSSFELKEYTYDMSLTDAQGLATGLFQTLGLTKKDGDVTYTVTYSAAEHYRCVFAPST